MPTTHDNLVIAHPQECRSDMINEGEAAGRPLPANLSVPWALMRSSEVPDAKAYVTTSWVHPVDHEVDWVREHVHDYDEILMFLGNDPEDPDSLGAEVVMTLGGEEHVLTSTSAVYVPAGTTHCPLGFSSVDRPFRFIAMAMSGTGLYR